MQVLKYNSPFSYKYYWAVMTKETKTGGRHRSWPNTKMVYLNGPRRLELGFLRKTKSSGLKLRRPHLRNVST